MTNDQLATVQLVPPTPFSNDGAKVRYEVLADHLRRMMLAGIRVVLPAAGTGEFHSLSTEEVLGCVKTAREACGSETIILAPVGLGLGHALTIAERAADHGANGLLVMPFIHSYLADTGARDYFEAIARVSDLPMLAYKKGSVPSDQLLGELGGEGRLLGVKYAVNEIDAFQRFATAYGSNLGLFCGTAERFAPYFFLAGAKGYTSGAGNICPRLTLAMHCALMEGRLTDALDLLQILRPIEDFRARNGDSYNISLLKIALALEGNDFGPPRPPMRRIVDHEVEEIRLMLEPIWLAEANLAKG